MSVKPKIAWDLIVQVPIFVSRSVYSSALLTLFEHHYIIWWSQNIPQIDYLGY